MSNAKAVLTDRFVAPKNAFIPPSKPLVTPTLTRDNAPGVPLAKRSGLPALHLASIGHELAPVKPASVSQTKLSTKFEPEVDERYVVDDQTFIIRTRSLSIHDEEAKRYFFSNGGLDIFEDYGTLAAAYDALRRQKMSKLAGIKTSETRLANHDVKVYVPGTVTDAQRIRDKARVDAQKRRDNDEWLKAGIQRRTA